ENIWIGNRDDHRNAKNDTGENNTMYSVFFPAKAVCQKIKEGEGEGNERSRQCEKSEKFSYVKDLRNQHLQWPNRVLSLLARLDQIFRRNNTQNHKFPNQIDDERNRRSQENSQADFLRIAFHISHERGNNDLIGKSSEKDRKGQPR